ncbi:hypothetical protein [Enterocloster sp.]|jgi:hypothetical protein
MAQQRAVLSGDRKPESIFAFICHLKKAGCEQTDKKYHFIF